MPSVGTLISRVAARYLDARSQTMRGLARSALSQLRTPATAGTPRASISPASLPARATYAVWIAALPLFALTIFNLDLFLPRGAATVFRLLAGTVLLIEGVGLLPRRSPFRTTLIARLGASPANQATRIRQTARKHLVGAGLTLLGLVWFAAGSLDLLRGLLAL